MASVIGEVRGSACCGRASMPHLRDDRRARALSSAVKAHVVSRRPTCETSFALGQMVALYGKLEPSRSARRTFKMMQPQFEILPEAGCDGQDAEFAHAGDGAHRAGVRVAGRHDAVGREADSQWLRRVMWSCLRGAGREAGTCCRGDAAGGRLRERLGLPGRMEALQAVHFPAAGTPMAELMAARDAGAPAADLRRAVLSGAWAGAEAAADARARGHGVRHR